MNSSSSKKENSQVKPGLGSGSATLLKPNSASFKTKYIESPMKPQPIPKVILILLRLINLQNQSNLIIFIKQNTGVVKNGFTSSI